MFVVSRPGIRRDRKQRNRRGANSTPLDRGPCEAQQEGTPSRARSGACFGQSPVLKFARFLSRPAAEATLKFFYMALHNCSLRRIHNRKRHLKQAVPAAFPWRSRNKTQAGGAARVSLPLDWPLNWRVGKLGSGVSLNQFDWLTLPIRFALSFLFDRVLSSASLGLPSNLPFPVFKHVPRTGARGNILGNGVWVINPSFQNSLNLTCFPVSAAIIHFLRIQVQEAGYNRKVSGIAA